jgi:hypothetical protein
MALYLRQFQAHLAKENVADLCPSRNFRFWTAAGA